MSWPGKIVLLGLPGSGKSTLGKELALQLNYTFADLDQLIEQTAGRSIPQIFQEFGEAHFRQLETAALKEALLQNQLVLAVGGGTPCFFENMSVINTACSMYLDVPLAELAIRLQPHTANRPLLQQGDIAATIRHLHRERHDFYKKAQHVVSGNDITVDNLISEIKKRSPK